MHDIIILLQYNMRRRWSVCTTISYHITIIRIWIYRAATKNNAVLGVMYGIRYISRHVKVPSPPSPPVPVICSAPGLCEKPVNRRRRLGEYFAREGTNNYSILLHTTFTLRPAHRANVFPYGLPVPLLSKNWMSRFYPGSKTNVFEWID